MYVVGYLWKLVPTVQKKNRGRANRMGPVSRSRVTDQSSPEADVLLDYCKLTQLVTISHMAVVLTSVSSLSKFCTLVSNDSVSPSYRGTCKGTIMVYDYGNHTCYYGNHTR